MADNKRLFTVKIDDQDVEFAVIRPTPKVHDKATLVYNRAFRHAVCPEDGKPGALVRAKIEEVMRDQKLWDDRKQARYEEVAARFLENEKKLASGGMKLVAAKQAAIQMRRDRFEMNSLKSDRDQLCQMTAEAQAENARFNYYVSACTVYNQSGKSYFNDYEDYLAREDDPVAGPAAMTFGKLFYNVEDNFEHKYPENKFLLKYGFCNDKLQLINKSKQLVDVDGRLINEEGHYINEEGQLIDRDGNHLNEHGDYVLEFTSFLDDEGNPVEEVKPA